MTPVQASVVVMLFSLSQPDLRTSKGSQYEYANPSVCIFNFCTLVVYVDMMVASFSILES